MSFANIFRFTTTMALLYGLSFLIHTADASSSETNPSLAGVGHVLAELFLGVNDQTGLAGIKLTFDQLIDPTLDIEASVRRLDAMANTARRMAGENASPIQKLAAIRRYIYESGPWNNYQPFQYDLEDPYGENTRNKLLPVYLDKKLGNCVTMPFLFMILAEKLGVAVSASLAPVHIFVKYTDPDSGETWNLETTSGALPARDEWYRQNLPMTDLAIENGVYMQPLTRQETITVMAAVVADYYVEVGRYEEAITVYDEALKVYPKYVYAMAKRGTAFYHLLNNNFYSKYPTPQDIPYELRAQYNYWAEQNLASFLRAEELGWQPIN